MNRFKLKITQLVTHTRNYFLDFLLMTQLNTFILLILIFELDIKLVFVLARYIDLIKLNHFLQIHQFLKFCEVAVKYSKKLKLITLITGQEEVRLYFKLFMPS